MYTSFVFNKLKFIFVVIKFYYLHYYQLHEIFLLLPALCRLFSAQLIVVSRLDLSGCALLHGEYNASLHYFGGSLLFAGVSNAFWSQ